MNYLDFTSLLDGDPPYLALLSTFQFDPAFFESRLLKSASLKAARRIAVFMDANQWQLLLQRDVLASRLNRHYLVVPVRRNQGVFHPKLSVLLTETGGQVLCGSNNLTRSGCSSNLELLNSYPFDFQSSNIHGAILARQALSFFRRATNDADDEIARIVREWIDQVIKGFPWPKPVEGLKGQEVRLVDTYAGPLWDQISEAITSSQPQRFFIVSPFHDADGAICHDLAKRWPGAEVEILVQQGCTTLPISPLRSLKRFCLAELPDLSRRVHAKLFAWRGLNSSGCLVGSANFTSAAYSGRNVEAGLLLTDAWPMVEKLFDVRFSKRPLSLDDFEPGSDEPPESEEWTPPALSLSSAILLSSGHLLVTFQKRLDVPLDSLRVTVRTPGDKSPHVSVPLPRSSTGKETVALPEGKVNGAHGPLLATIVAEAAGTLYESPLVWIVQENYLTHEPSDRSTSSRGRVEETGEGLPEYLDGIGSRGGVAGIAEYLQHLNIRFYDGKSAGHGTRRFRVKISDPFESNKVPDWLIRAHSQSAELSEAIIDFVERHETQKLHKHVRRGNVNGMDNFLDILTTLVRLMYIYVKRNVLKRHTLLGRLCNWIELTTSGRDTDKEIFDGYLYSVWDSLNGDETTLNKVCADAHYCAEVRALLLIAQKLRYVPGEVPEGGTPPKSQRDVLKRQASIVDECFTECNLSEPTEDEIRQALERYKMFSVEEIDVMIAAV